ncbi:MAG: glucan biosynthesis protein D [Thiomonas sp.]|nr:glucan biosynthesis protein D [Thiomonas sp.]
MHRRDFLRGSAANFAALAPWPMEFKQEKRPPPSAPARGIAHFGAPQQFSFAWLKGLAQAKSLTAYSEPVAPLPAAVQKLSWDQWQSISYRSERTLWCEDDLFFRIRFDYLGYNLTRPVRMYALEQNIARLIPFDPDLFDYSRSGLKPDEIPKQLGFSGFNVLFHTNWADDRAVFQGASYFRAVDASGQYGMSQRGLAIDTGMARPEEFPDFVAFYLQKPAPESTLLTVYALLDSPSVTGAYRFIIDVASTLVMDVDFTLYPRRRIERLGIAPGTSMYLVGENDHRVADDWRPQIHDSDGLQMHTGVGEWIWRPLTNPAHLHVNSYLDDNPRGFGLMQRDHDFADYQDDGVWYDRRPSCWVAPKGAWGKGAVMLVEIPTIDETMDNIVAFWNPAEEIVPGRDYSYGYRLYWCRENPFESRLGHVQATRDGIGGIVGQKRSEFSWRFVIDFVGGDLPMLVASDKVRAVVSTSQGHVQLVSARPLLPLKGWRAMFDLVPDEAGEPINLRLFLQLDGQALTETWIYQYTPPPLAVQRSYVQT